MDSLPVIQSAVDRLSDEIWLLVLSQVAVDSLPSLAACMSVSRAWHRLCTDNHVWRAAFLGLNRQLGLDDRLAPPSLHDWSATSWYNLVKDQVAFCRTWAPNKWVTDDHITIPEDGKRPIQELASFSLTLIDLIGPHPEQSVVNIRKAAVDSFHDQANDHTSSPRKGILAVLADHSAPANDPQHLQQRPSVLNQSRVLHFLNLETLEPFSRLLIPEMPNVPLVPGFVPAHWVQLGHVDATRRQFTLFLRVGSHKTSLRLYSIDQAVSYGIESVLDLQVLASHEFPGHVWFGDQPLHPHPTEPNRLMLMFTNLYTDLVTVHHLDATTFELVKVIEIHAPMGSRHYDADFGTLIITTCEYGAVRIWSADTGECLYAFQVAHLAAVDFAIWRPWVRPGLELEPSSKADGAIQNVDKPTAYMDPKWLQVLSVTMPLAEFGLGAPMGLALHSVRSASALVPAVFVNESTDPDPDSKTDVPGIVWRGKAVNPPPPPTPENPEPVVFPEDIEVAPLSANAATVLRYQARHSRLMAFLAGYQLLFTVDLDGVLNVTNMATGKDWGPLVSATQSASEAAQSRPSRLQDVYHGDSIMSRTLTLNAFEFLTPLRPQSPPVATAQTPRSTSTDPSADPHLPPLSAAITAPDLLDALLNHPLPEQAASTLGAAALLGTVPMAVIQSVLHQLPDSGMEQDRIDAIFNGMQAGGISTLAQMGEPPALPPPTSQSAEPLNTQPAHPEYVADLPPLPTCILSMAEELRKAARLATDIAPTLTEPASVAMEAADRASSAMSHLESHPPVTADGAPDPQALAAICTRHAVQLWDASRGLRTDVADDVAHARDQVRTAAAQAGRSDNQLRLDLRDLAHRELAGLRSIETMMDVHGRAIMDSASQWLAQQGPVENANVAVQEIGACVETLRDAHVQWKNDHRLGLEFIMKFHVAAMCATVGNGDDQGAGAGASGMEGGQGSSGHHQHGAVDSVDNALLASEADWLQQASEPVNSNDLVACVLAMADQLMTVPSSGLESSEVEMLAISARELADDVRATMEAHFVSSPHTSSSNPDALLDIAMACVNGTSELMAAARSLMSCLSTVVAGPAMGTSTPFSLSSSAMTARAILGCIRSVSCVGADRFVSTVLCVLRDQGLAQNHLDVMTQHLREQQASVDAALDRVSTSLDALVQQQAIEATAAVPGIGQEQGAAGDVEGGNGGIVAEDAMVIESDSNDPVASAPTPATAPVPIPGQEAQLEPEPEPQQEPPFQQVQADVDDDMMLADAPGAAWDPDQDATYPFGDVMWLDRSWERILVYRGKSLMVLAKPRPTGEHDSNQSSNE